MTYGAVVVFFETTIFTKQIKLLISDEEYAKLQLELSRRPKQGPVIRKSGGIRKLRWAVEGSGRSGGVRVLYYVMSGCCQIYMLLAFKKGDQENITAEQLAVLRNVVQEELING